MTRLRLVLLLKRQCLKQVEKKLAHLAYTVLVDSAHEAQDTLEYWLVEIGPVMAIFRHVLRDCFEQG